MKLFSAISLFLIYLTHMAYAQPAIPESIKANIRARVDNGENKNIIVGVLDEKGKHYYSYGHISEENKIAPKKYTVYEIGSITKVFTGLALAHAVVRGELDLEDELSKFLPDSINFTSHEEGPITLLHLINHHSGLPRMPTNIKFSDPENPFVDYTPTLMWDFLDDYKPSRAPEAKYEYSNYATGLLGHILSTQAGVSFDELVKTKICLPLKLTDTRVLLNEDQKIRLSPGHNGTQQVKNWDFASLDGAGALKSTTSDLLDFLKYYLEYESSSLKSAMSLSQEKTMGIEPEKMDVALGWHISYQDDAVIHWHNGGTGGYRSYMGFDKNQKKGIVVLTNSNEGVDDIGIHYLAPKAPLKEVKPLPKIKEEILTSYVGTYELAPGYQFTITKVKQNLRVQLTGQPAFDIYPESESKFFLRVVDAQISFQKNDKDEVISLTLHQNGMNQVAKKIE